MSESQPWLNSLVYNQAANCMLEENFREFALMNVV